jgi:uncharacterized membrane protein YkvA (DUF1232 family)
MNDFQEFVLTGSQKITPAQIAQFENELPMVLAKINEVNPSAQPHLLPQVQFLVRYVEDCLDNKFQPTDVGALAEAIFALMYLYKGVDIIPDNIPDIGFSDDSAVVRTVLKSHRDEFTRFGEVIGKPFSGISTEP